MILKNIGEYLFASESVSDGHPDKLCDQISDAILDLYLKHDPYARTAIEVLATKQKLVIAGEVRGGEAITYAMIEEVARQTIRNIGYVQGNFSWDRVNIEMLLNGQSEDIAKGVDASENKDEGAGDQGMMFGFACNQTPEYMPAAISYAHRILYGLKEARNQGKLSMLGPDAKSQVTLLFQNGQPVRAHSVLVSTQHHQDISAKEVKEIIYPFVKEALPEGWMCEDEKFLVNPTGRFVIGGPEGDCGLTGRKIIVDTYGGAAPHGGGAFSGKDPTKVDRSAAYAARYVAKNIVASGLASACTIQVSYAIGLSYPLSLYVSTHDTGSIPDTELVQLISQVMDWSPRGIREHLKLNAPIYQPTAAYGHFGRTPTEGGVFSWEKLDLVDILKQAA